MYEQVLRQMQGAVRAGRIQFNRHALNELAMDDLSPKDAGNCILTGEIIEDQYDELYGEEKYVIYGDTLAGDEMAVVARWDESQSGVVITVYRLRITDYA
ncbi:MAG: DUF4258 domain-containing protein [Blastocatellia bacterium]